MTNMTGNIQRRTPIVSMRNIGKSFGSVRVLGKINFDIYPGEVHLLAGENGAGKSTLIKILGGIYPHIEGSIQLKGEIFKPSTPLDANRQGIAVIHQELSLIPQMTVMENLQLGRFNTRGGFVSYKNMERKSLEVLEKFGIQVRPHDYIEDISISQQQLIEIGKATSMNAQVIVMDEPSSALSREDAEILFSLIDQLKTMGCGIVYITHRMEEIERLADRITVLRDGRLVSTGAASEYTPRKIISDMVGRELEETFVRKESTPGEVVLRLNNFSLKKYDSLPFFKNINLSLHEGEILGLGGLQGSGASALLSAIFGKFGNRPTGQLELNGRIVKKLSPGRSITCGMGFITNDRKSTGLVLPMSLTQNITMASIPQFCRSGFLQKQKEYTAADKMKNDLAIKAASLEMAVHGLSGGNQQKVVLAKWMQISPRILLMDEPTRGVDIGAKWEIYKLLEDLISQGVSIILITSELSELLALSNRIVVMHRGSVVREFEKKEFDAGEIISTAMGKNTKNQERNSRDSK